MQKKKKKKRQTQKTVLLGLRRKLTAKGKRQLIPKSEVPTVSRSPPSPAGGSLGAVGVVPLDRSTEDLSCVQRKCVCVCRGGGAGASEKVIGTGYQELSTILFFRGMRASCLLVCLRQPFITTCTVSNPTLF